MSDRQRGFRRSRRSEVQIRKLGHQRRIPVGRHRDGRFWFGGNVMEGSRGKILLQNAGDVDVGVARPQQWLRQGKGGQSLEEYPLLC